MAADISSDELSSSATFRAITGGDNISAEHKNRQPFMFTPYVRMIFSANKFPPIVNPTNALFDRWIVIPFEGRFRGTGAEIPDLHELIIGTELPGVLNYALAGLARLRAQGRFSASEASSRALAAFRIQADSIASFLGDEEVAFKPGTFYKMKDVWAAYLSWISEAGATKGLGRQAFCERVRALWGQETKRSGYNGWVARES
jgi:putative DNA primase/helicase